MKILERVKWLDMYGVDLNAVKGQDNMDYLLGLTPTGIVLYKAKNKIGSFIWYVGASSLMCLTKKAFQ